jgi:sulfur carrier protein
MRIDLNGDWRELALESETDVASALEQLGYGRSVVATALNGEFIAAAERASTRLRDGDRLEVLAPMQGG